jgi:hypothetical protein
LLIVGQEEALALKKKIEEEAKAQKIIANDRERARYIVNAEKAKLDGMELSLEKRRQLEACLLRDRVKKKTSQVGFLGFLGVFFGFFLGFCFFLFFFVFLYICPEERVFKVFQFQEYFKVHPDFKL